jgi:hypothetical protein
MNTVYLIDAESTCVGVIDRRTGLRISHHHLVGCILTGARRDTERGHEIQTLPQIGWQATFEKPRDGAGRWVDPRLFVTTCVQAIWPL